MAFGHVRAVIGKESAMLFDAADPNIKVPYVQFHIFMNVVFLSP